MSSISQSFGLERGYPCHRRHNAFVTPCIVGVTMDLFEHTLAGVAGAEHLRTEARRAHAAALSRPRTGGLRALLHRGRRAR